MLHQELGHDLPAFARRGIGIVGAVNLRHARAGHEFLGYRRIHKTAVHVDIAVEHIVLRVLMRPVDAFFHKEHRNLRAGDA